MKDYKIGDLGATNGINGINGRNTEVQGAKQEVKVKFNMAEALRRFGAAKPTAQTPPQTGIRDLSLPPHAIQALANVASAQNGISADRPLTNPRGETLVIAEQDYIPDEAFKEKAYAEA